MVTNVLLMVTNILPMMTDVSQEIEYCQPTNSCKNGRKMEQRWVGNTAFANELPDSLVVLVKFIELVGIGAINYLSGTIIGIGGVPDKIFGHQQQSWHRRPDDIGTRSQSSNQAVSSWAAAIDHRISQG
jgi:hypothetical protein